MNVVAFKGLRPTELMVCTTCISAWKLSRWTANLLLQSEYHICGQQLWTFEVLNAESKEPSKITDININT